jgi:hypothetical protein
MTDEEFFETQEEVTILNYGNYDLSFDLNFMKILKELSEVLSSKATPYHFKIIYKNGDVLEIKYN